MDNNAKRKQDFIENYFTKKSRPGSSLQKGL